MAEHNTSITIAELNTQWVLDSQIDETKLSSEALRVPRLHQKYHRYLSDERLRLEALRSHLTNQEVILECYYLKTLTPAELREHQLIYDEYKYTKLDVPKLLIRNKTIQAIKNQILTQVEKVKYLESIMAMIQTLNFSIKNSIDDKKFKAGGY